MADDARPAPQTAGAGFEIFRTANAPSLDETSHMEVVGMNPEFEAGITKALESGFATLSRFNRCFKEHRNMTPRDWRKRTRRMVEIETDR